MTHPLRLLQALVVFLSGVFALFVFAGNLMDYDSNFQFVKHVLSMDTTFDGNALMWRAITEPWIHHLAYLGIIVSEGTFAALAITGGVMLFLRRDDTARFTKAKVWGFSAYGLGLLIWFFGFVIVGSEWFAMWQSSSWNGKDTAMSISMLWAVFAVLLAMNEPVRDAASPSGDAPVT